MTAFDNYFGVNLLWMTLSVCETTLFYFVRVLKEVRIALSIFFRSKTLSNGSITLVYKGSLALKSLSVVFDFFEFWVTFYDLLLVPAAAFLMLF